MHWLLRCNAILSAVCKAIMPSSKRWKADECRILAIAVSNASQNKSDTKKVGANQKLGQLQAKIFDNVRFTRISTVMNGFTTLLGMSLKAQPSSAPQNLATWQALRMRQALRMELTLVRTMLMWNPRMKMIARRM